jgi:hypothetical protein
MHYFIIIAIIAIIIIIQVRFFYNTRKKINVFLWIFPANKDAYKLSNESLIEKILSASDDELDTMLANAGLNYKNYYYIRLSAEKENIPCFRREKAKDDLIQKLANTRSSIFVEHNNSTFTTIVDSINDYLKNNKSVSDYHLMKDIVDRNCDAKEEEISTQIPIPLYMGLVGTMAGILVGVGFLVFGGGLTDLLSSGNNNDAHGVETLLGGVAIAMISSILGIILTTVGSIQFKNAKSTVESGKHIFLSWIQAHLLPTLSDNVVGAIREMTGNLTDFNKQFSDNTGNLGTALAKVNESYKLQTQLIDAVNRIQEGRTASTNLALLSKLIESSEQIGTLAGYLHNTNEYLANVRALNEKLDLQESRTRAIENVGAFFKTELTQIENRKGEIAKAVGKLDDYLQQALEKLKENTDNQFRELQKSTVKQQDILQQNMKEVNAVVAELKNLTEIKKGIAGFENAIKGQNEKIDKLVNAIEKLAKAKAEGTNAPISFKPKMPAWQKALIGAVMVVGGLVVLALIVANWQSIFREFIMNFRI